MNKITASFSVLATTAIIAFSGSAALAAPAGPTAAWCKARHHTNAGQCKKDWNNWVKNHSKPPKVPNKPDKPGTPVTVGSGYGSASSNINLTLNNSNNNIIQIVINQVVNIFR